MVTRREFLQGSAGVVSTATVTLLVTRLIGCSTTDNGTATSTGTTVPACDGVGATSGVALGHTHDICVAASDLTSPPAAGMTYTTTPSVLNGLAHTHSISLTQAQLQAIQAGQSVMVETSSPSTAAIASHTHSFAIVRMAMPPAAPVGGGGGGFGY
jgi:hypothetical protein